MKEEELRIIGSKDITESLKWQETVEVPINKVKNSNTRRTYVLIFSLLLVAFLVAIAICVLTIQTLHTQRRKETKPRKGHHIARRQLTEENQNKELEKFLGIDNINKRRRRHIPEAVIKYYLMLLDHVKKQKSPYVNVSVEEGSLGRKFIDSVGKYLKESKEKASISQKVKPTDIPSYNLRETIHSKVKATPTIPFSDVIVAGPKLSVKASKQTSPITMSSLTAVKKQSVYAVNQSPTSAIKTATMSSHTAQYQQTSSVKMHASSSFLTSRVTTIIPGRIIIVKKWPEPNKQDKENPISSKTTTSTSTLYKSFINLTATTLIPITTNTTITGTAAATPTHTTRVNTTQPSTSSTGDTKRTNISTKETKATYKFTTTGTTIKTTGTTTPTTNTTTNKTNRNTSTTGTTTFKPNTTTFTTSTTATKSNTTTFTTSPTTTKANTTTFTTSTTTTKANTIFNTSITTTKPNTTTFTTSPTTTKANTTTFTTITTTTKRNTTFTTSTTTTKPNTNTFTISTTTTKPNTTTFTTGSTASKSNTTTFTTSTTTFTPTITTFTTGSTASKSNTTTFSTSTTTSKPNATTTATNTSAIKIKADKSFDLYTILQESKNRKLLETFIKNIIRNLTTYDKKIPFPSLTTTTSMPPKTTTTTTTIPTPTNKTIYKLTQHCRQDNTSWGAEKIIGWKYFIISQPIRCRNNEILKSFHLVHNNDTVFHFFRYEFICCSLQLREEVRRANGTSKYIKNKNVTIKKEANEKQSTWNKGQLKGTNTGYKPTEMINNGIGIKTINKKQPDKNLNKDEEKNKLRG